MNYCRTCKFWSQNPHAVGMGNCINMEMHMHILLPRSALVTSQDFGCVLHQSGYCTARLYPDEEADRIMQDFLKSPRPTQEEK